MKILLTGATGFVGRHLIPRLLDAGHTVRAAVRNEQTTGGTDTVVVGEIGPRTDWTAALSGIDTVVHLAGRAHRADAPGEAEAHDAVNHQGTRQLAEACAGRVERLIFLSSLSVHGLNASPSPIDEDTPIRPTTPYGEGKARAEAVLAELKATDQLASLSLRPPMIHGPGAPGNLARLRRAVVRGLPLPLASVRNRRSLIGIEALATAILAALEIDQAAFQALPPALCVADDSAIATPDMIRALAEGAGRRPRLWPCPPALLHLGGRISGRRAMIDSLCGDLMVDNRRSRQALALPSSPTPYPALVEASRQDRRQDSRKEEMDQ